MAKVARTELQNVEREIALMKKMRHPHMVELYEVIDDTEHDRLLLGALPG